MIENEFLLWCGAILFLLVWLRNLEITKDNYRKKLAFVIQHAEKHIANERTLDQALRSIIKSYHKNDSDDPARTKRAIDRATKILDDIEGKE